MRAVDTHDGKLRYHDALRPNLLAIVACTFVASWMCLLPGFPFHPGFCVAAAVSSAVHLAAFLFFKGFEARPWTFEAMALFNILLLGFIVHFTGGIMSPFVFFYFWILASAIIYGVKDRVATYFAMVTYGGLVLAEASGLLAPFGTASREVYASRIMTAMVAAAILFFIMMTRYITTLVLENLRARLERENSEKEGLLKKFSELDSTAQIGSLAHRIAHDLRAPLSSISGYVQMELMRKHPADKMSELLDLNATVTSMAESLHCITRFGKVTAVPAERIQVTEFFRQLLAIAAFSPQARGVRFIKSYQAGHDVCVCASRSDMQQAYFNIVKNALEATQDNSGGRTIEVSVRVVEKEVEVCVADNGPGMPPEMLKNLFRKSITTKKDGTGVGLVITRDILARNDGYMEFRNRTGGGLAVVTRLPVA
ncbi:MAG: hypothetical protein A2049_05265 [Elusimicrobia bacterium GWA2_62_23]|nr:MAG: hypothetical protein A2049_05265 [Elusimicrobia bacterium GWA2_62_23]OGR68282.1 MAG: hypothetical protein A2179_01870 [Elusimicrobia bacterium GWC2_63_65]